MWIKVAESYNAPLSSRWVTIFIVLACGYGHCGKRRPHNGTDTVIFGLGDGDPGREILQAIIFLVVTAFPCLFFGWTKCMHLEECRCIDFLKISCGDMSGNCLGEV